MPRLSLSADFPSEEFDAIVLAADALEMNFRQNNGGTSSPNWAAFTSAMNGLTYRWSALTQADETFSETFVLETASPSKRCCEESALFGFFTNALSAFETTFLGCYALIAQLDPANYDAIVAKPRTVNPKLVTEVFEANFPSDPLTNALRTTLDSALYATVKSNRDILSHRGSPPRHFGYQPPSIPGSINISTPETIGWQGLNLTSTFTADLRTDIARLLTDLLSAERIFAEARSNKP